MSRLDQPEGDRFDGPGEMRDRFRSADWSATSVGPPEDWPPLLTAMVELCLDSGFPMVVSWGADVTLLYNDAYIPLLGADLHPWALGRPAREIWPAAWSTSGPLVAEVMERGRSVRRDDMQMVLERNGYPEECYFTFSQSPIRHPDGSVAGVFTVAAETTGHVLHRRRLGVIQTLGTLSATHAGSPAEICQAALDVLAGARASLPFAAVVLRQQEDAEVGAVAGYGIADESALSTLVGASSDEPVVAAALRTGRAVPISGLRASHPDAFEAGPIGELHPDQAVALPLTISGDAGTVGALVVGINPYRPLDAQYLEFVETVARQLSVALADSYAYQRERGKVSELADLDRVKTEFFQNVSHELRTPLTLLLAPLQDLLNAGTVELPATERANVGAALRAAQRLQRMVDALLTVSQAAGPLIPELRETDVAALTADVASMFRSTAEHAGLEFVVEPAAAAISAVVDPAMWSTVVNNLVSNAVKYTVRGRVVIGVRMLPEGDLELTVRDSGVGIPADEQSRVFDRFHRSDTGGDADGAGIGLALVANLVAAHGGSITLQSEPGVGSTFTVTLPSTGRLADPLTTQQPMQSPTPPADTDRPRLLLVEDDDDLREYLGQLLTGDGWFVESVADAESAIDAAFSPDRDAVPELILTDIMLPGRSGLELLDTLRTAERTARVPIILLTAMAGADAAIDGLASGADDYITKPFASPELLARVRVHHQLSQLREDAVGDAETRVDKLRLALDSNRVIGTATGIVMSTYGLPAADGFQLLVRASQHTNRKLRDLAADVVQTGTLPLPAPIAAEFVAAEFVKGDAGPGPGDRLFHRISAAPQGRPDTGQRRAGRQ